MGTGDSTDQQPKPWLVEARRLRDAKAAAKAERKARGPKPRSVLTLVCRFEGCRHEFTATRADARYCSPTCRSNARRRREREERPVLQRRALRLR